MGVQIKREDPKPATEPIEAVTIKGVGSRSITVRNGSATDKNQGLRTIECAGPSYSFKWTATLGDIGAFGEALVEMAKGGK